MCTFLMLAIKICTCTPILHNVTSDLYESMMKMILAVFNFVVFATEGLKSTDSMTEIVEAHQFVTPYHKRCQSYTY